jgi:hypothetical protein
MLHQLRIILVFVIVILVIAGSAIAWDPLPVKDDPLVRSPGTQPVPENAPNIEGPTRCMNCHGGYDSAVEPAFNWQGSMMAQAARDPIFWACFTVAAQDVIWAVGNPNGTDICERCHFPKGWLEGRSDPTNASLFVGDDYDGVQCDVCHSMFDPFFETTYAGTREGSDWLNYWDETNASDTPSQTAAEATYNEDARLANGIMLFNGGSFYNNSNLPPENYKENAVGQMFIDDVRDKRASFADANARHPMFYSRYHKSKYFCSTCHDVSNPILANLGADPTQPLPTETNSAFSFYHVERTFSEFMLSDYGQQGGAATNPEFQAQGAPNITHVSKCQDCHMRDVTGKGASQRSAVLRPNESTEHPSSGQPVHDLTGGNAWVGYILASLVPASPNYDPVNENLLVNQVHGPLTLDVNQGVGIDPQSLLAGVERAKQQLLLAATIKNLDYNGGTGSLSFDVQNNTPHKLISGFPEGRRMFVNVKAFSGGNLVYEVNPYDPAGGTLKGLTYPYQTDIMPAPAGLGANEVYDDALVYEAKPSSLELTGEYKTFHFALATDRYKDNRIPPRGFRIADSFERISQPRAGGADAPDLYTDAEYAGGYDNVSLGIVSGADYVEVNLYYQTTSREYMEFLRDEIKGTGNLTLTGTGAGGDEPYLIQTDNSGFFDGLKAWGVTIWDLWTNNMTVPGASPIIMAQATIGDPGGGGCDPIAAPVLDPAVPASNQVTLTWSAVPGAEGYIVYYDQAGKSQLIADVGNTTTFEDTGLINDNVYCYKVTAFYTCDAQTVESAFSNIECAVPTGPGQTLEAGVTAIDTGFWSGKGKNQQFVLTTVFNRGDTIIFQVYVVDQDLAPVEGAVVDLAIDGPAQAAVTTDPTDAAGFAEGSWTTISKGGNKTPLGNYTASTVKITALGYVWDGVPTAASFTLQ